MKRSWKLLLVCVSIGSSLYASIDTNGTKQSAKKIRYGKVVQIRNAAGYKYLKVDQNGTMRWVAIADAPVRKGDRIGYDTQSVMKNFHSKVLGQTFDEIVFANEIYLPERSSGSLKSALQEAQSSATSVQADDSDFKEKAFYTVEEVHKWRKKLAGKRIKVKGRVYKVARDIMKRDWVHIGDGTGEEAKLTDDLVFTAKSVTIEAGDRVIAEGTIATDKNFGFGYFYDVLAENAEFKVVVK